MSIAQPLPAEIRRLFPQRFVAWQRQGLSARASSAAALACCDTVAEIMRLGRPYFENLPNVGTKTLEELAGQNHNRCRLHSRSA